MKKMWTMSTKLFFVATLAISVALVPRLEAQVQTEVPPVVPGAKPVTVEHIKIHGTALEGNLEGEAVDRDVIVFLPAFHPRRSRTPAGRRAGLRSPDHRFAGIFVRRLLPHR